MSAILNYTFADFINKPAYPYARLYDVNTPVHETSLGLVGPEGSQIWVLAVPIVYHNMSNNTILGMRDSNFDFDVCHLPLRNKEPASKKIPVGKWGLRVKPKQSDGYFQFGNEAVPGQRIHSALWFSAHSTVKKVPTWHISHLCHNWWCCNPRHATYEPDWVNIMRKHCPFVPSEVACTCVSVKHASLRGRIPPCLFMNAETRARLGANTEDCVNLNWLIKDNLDESGLMRVYAGKKQLWEAIRKLIAGR